MSAMADRDVYGVAMSDDQLVEEAQCRMEEMLIDGEAGEAAPEQGAANAIAAVPVPVVANVDANLFVDNGPPELTEEEALAEFDAVLDELEGTYLRNIKGDPVDLEAGAAAGRRRG